MQKLIPTWGLLFAFVCAFVAEVSAQGTQAGRIVLARVTGQVTLTLKSDGSTRAAVNNEQIAAGYVVTTAPEASVVLVFSNGATVNLRGDSVLDIESFLQDPFAEDFKIAEATAEPSTSTTRLNLTRGEMIGNVKRLNAAGGSSFTVQTPMGAAGIRGTTFRIIFRPDGTGRAQFSITTIEGNVVLIQGGVEIPIDATSGEAREISVEVDVQVDPATGLLTVQIAGLTLTAQIAPAASVAQVIQAVQQIVEVVAAQVFPPPGGTPPDAPPAPNDQPSPDGPPDNPPAPGEGTPPPSPNGGTPPAPNPPGETPPSPGTGTNAGGTPPPPPPPPPPLPPPPRTTSGDGAPD